MLDSLCTLLLQATQPSGVDQQLVQMLKEGQMGNTWPGVVLAIAVVLFGANGAVIMMIKNRAEQFKVLSDELKALQAKVGDQNGLIGELKGKLELFSSQLEVSRKEHQIQRTRAVKYRTALRLAQTELRAAHERIEDLTRVPPGATLLTSVLPHTPHPAGI